MDPMNFMPTLFNKKQQKINHKHRFSFYTSYLLSGRKFGVLLTSLVLSVSLQTTNAEEPRNDRLKVSTGLVELYEHTQKMEVPGVWVAKSEITISSPLQAIRVKRVLVDEGDSVKEGQLLAELEDNSLLTNVSASEGLLAQVQAKVGEIAVRKREADSLYSRSLKLKATNSISAQQLDELSAAAKSLHHQLTAAEAELKQVTQQVIESQSQLEKSKVKAPADGVISARFIHEGELVNFSPLFKIFSMSELEFEAMVTQNMLSQIYVGMPVDIIITRGNNIPAKVRLISTSIQRETGIATIRIKPTAKTPQTISAGTASKAVFSVQSIPQKTVNSKAVRYEGITPYVFVVDENQCVQIRPIEAGARYVDKIEVLSGLDVSERIVLSSAAYLKDGDCVIAEPPKVEERQTDEDDLNLPIDLDS